MKYACNIHSCPFKCHKIISSAIQSHLKCHYYNPMKLKFHYGLHGIFGIIMAFCGIIPWFFPVDFIEFHYGWRCTDVCKTPGMGTVAWGTLKRPSAMAETKPHLMGAFLPGTGQKTLSKKSRDVVFALNVAHFPNGKPLLPIYGKFDMISPWQYPLPNMLYHMVPSLGDIYSQAYNMILPMVGNWI